MSSIKICFLCYGYEVFISCKNTYLLFVGKEYVLPSPIEKYFVFVFLKHFKNSNLKNFNSKKIEF